MMDDNSEKPKKRRKTVSKKKTPKKTTNKKSCDTCKNYCSADGNGTKKNDVITYTLKDNDSYPFNQAYEFPAYWVEDTTKKSKSAKSANNDDYIANALTVNANGKSSLDDPEDSLDLLERLESTDEETEKILTKISVIINKFDFRTVLKTLKFLGYKMNGITPTLQLLEDQAILLLTKVAFQNIPELCGNGFVARMSTSGVLSLAFELDYADVQ